MLMHLIDIGHRRNADFLLVLLQLVVVCDVCYFFFFFSFFCDHSNTAKSTSTVRDHHPTLLIQTAVPKIYSRRR
jgi:hypothetical protein